MGRRSGGESAAVNGFGGAQAGAGAWLSTAAAAAGLGAPVVGALYGVVRVGYEEYYRGLGLSPEMVGLGQAAIVSRVGVIIGLAALLIATFLAFGVTIYRLARPLTSRSTKDATWYVQLGWLAAPFAVLTAIIATGLVLRWLGAGAGGRFWTVGALSSGVVALQLSWFAGLQPEMGAWGVRAIRFVYVNSLPKVGWLLIAAVGGGYMAVSVEEFWKGSARAGRQVKQTGQLPVDYLNVTVSPARIIPKDRDRLGVCDGSREAVLVGRSDDVSFVLLLPGRSGEQSEVVPLNDTDYAVATATGEPRSCSPRVP